MSDLDALLEGLDKPGADDPIHPREIIVDAKTGQPRQAGATTPEGKFIVDFRKTAEQSLYAFGKGVLGFTRLTTSLHLPTAEWLTKIPPFRKLLLLPRDHLKTSLCSRALPMHVVIQPKESNLYYPGREGCNLRILLAGEKAENAENQLGWIAARFESNKTMRALWPHRLWEHPRRDARKWNASAIMLPRSEDYPEATIETIGVGGAVTGRHYDIMIKDDLTTLQAANSTVVMQTAIEWHEASRSLFDHPDHSLEFTIGTRWAVNDLYQHMIDNDPTVEWLKRAVIEDGKIIFPEMFSHKTIDEYKTRLGTLFPLLYMNEAADPSLVDFALADLREFRIIGDDIVFDEDERDLILAERQNAPKPDFSALLRGRPLSREEYQDFFSRSEYLRLKYQ